MDLSTAIARLMKHRAWAERERRASPLRGIGNRDYDRRVQKMILAAAGRRGQQSQILNLTQKLRQLGDIRRDLPCLVLREQLGRRSPAQVFFEVEVPERLPIRIAHDEASVVIFNCPW